MIGVLIVADIRLYSEGLASILSRDHRFASIEAASNRSSALEAVIEHAPDVVLLDMTMPESSETASSLKALKPALSIVALAVPELEAEILACAEAGVVGYVPREASVTHLIDVIVGAVHGEVHCTPRIAGSLFRRVHTLASTRPEIADVPRLTTRELEVAELIDLGMSNKGIADRLCIEVSTVKNHVHNLLEKTQVHRRGEAAAKLRPALVQMSNRRGVPAP